MKRRMIKVIPSNGFIPGSKFRSGKTDKHTPSRHLNANGSGDFGVQGCRECPDCRIVKQRFGATVQTLPAVPKVNTIPKAADSQAAIRVVNILLSIHYKI